MLELYLRQIFIILSIHFFADYVLQTRFIAESKGQNWYHMFIHCVLYSAPFAMHYGLDWRILVILLTHIVIDAGKARYYKVTYVQDQVLHLLILFLLYFKC